MNAIKNIPTLDHPKLRRTGPLSTTAVLVALGVLFVLGLLPKLRQKEALASEAAAAQTLARGVHVASVKRGPATSELVLPGTVHGLEETEIHARTNGYLKRWFVDIGGRVEAGALLAEIDAPEVEQELGQARATLERAGAALAQQRAQLDLTRATLERWKAASARGGVSQQELDEKQAAFSVADADVRVVEAEIRADAANVARLEQLIAFEKVTAPFAGTLTERNVDVGALIQAGSANSRPMFKLARTDALRIFVQVPQAFVKSVAIGMPAEVTARELRGRKFSGNVTRTAEALDPTARTLQTEVDLANEDRALLPGMYVNVKFVFKRDEPPVTVPASAIIVGGANGTSVATVTSGNVLRFRAVALGRDHGNEVEVASGLGETERVVTDSSVDVADGTPVRILSGKQ
jgi:RND family efflux transporter MFP subunit